MELSTPPEVFQHLCQQGIHVINAPRMSGKSTLAYTMRFGVGGDARVVVVDMAFERQRDALLDERRPSALDAVVDRSVDMLILNNMTLRGVVAQSAFSSHLLTLRMQFPSLTIVVIMPTAARGFARVADCVWHRVAEPYRFVNDRGDGTSIKLQRSYAYAVDNRNGGNG